MTDRFWTSHGIVGGPQPLLTFESGSPLWTFAHPCRPNECARRCAFVIVDSQSRIYRSKRKRSCPILHVSEPRAKLEVRFERRPRTENDGLSTSFVAAGAYRRQRTSISRRASDSTA